MKTVLFLALLLYLVLADWGRCESPLLRISQFNTFDEGFFGESHAGPPLIDVVQDICGREDKNGDGDLSDPDDVKLEELYDTVLGIRVVNRMNVAANVRRFTYTLKISGGSGRFRSKAIAPLSESIVDPGSEKQLFFLFIRAKDGAKYFNGADSPISPSLGFKNVSILLRGRTAGGKAFRLRGRLGLSFGAYQRCSS